MLHGIDIASWQAGISPSATPSDFVIVKATGGTGYVNPYWRAWADETLASGKLLGIYHYAMEYGTYSEAAEEARFFLDTIKDYIGKAVLILDWENDALSLPVSYAKEWLDTVARETGARPWFYGYASNVNSTDYSSIANYPLWMASYLYKYDGAGFVDDPDNPWETGDWAGMTAYQYTSTGYIPGYDGRLDLSVFYGSREDWLDMCGGYTPEQPDSDPENNNGLAYRVHCQNIGWQTWVHDGMIAGTTGFSLRAEALEVKFPDGWEVEIRAHVENEGWQTVVAKGGKSAMVGTTGKAQRIECLGLKVLKAPDKKQLWFQVHQEYAGWKQWTPAPYYSGTDGMALRLEAFKLVLR